MSSRGPVESGPPGPTGPTGPTGPHAAHALLSIKQKTSSRSSPVTSTASANSDSIGVMRRTSAHVTTRPNSWTIHAIVDMYTSCSHDFGITIFYSMFTQQSEITERLSSTKTANRGSQTHLFRATKGPSSFVGMFNNRTIWRKSAKKNRVFSRKTWS